MKRTLVLIPALMLAAASNATLTLVTNRADIVACDMVDWGHFGAPGTVVASPSAGWTQEGTKFLVSDDSNMDLSTDVTSGIASSGHWWGFGAGHNVIVTPSNNGPLSVAFAQTYCAGGADIMVNFFGTYTAEVSAYDAIGDFLGAVTTTVVSDANIVGNAPFLGVKSDHTDIARLEYRLKTTDQTGGFAIDEMSLNCCCVPEPASMATFGIGVIGIFARKRSKRTK